MKNTIKTTLLTLLFVSSTAWAVDQNLGGQVVQCSTDSKVTNYSLASFEGMLEGLGQPNIPGNKLTIVMDNLLKRLERINPSRVSEFKMKLLDFESRASRLYDIELFNPLEWNESIIPKNCRVSKLILQRVPKRPGEKQFLINQTLWEELSPQTLAVATLEALFFEELLYSDRPTVSISNLRPLYAILATEKHKELSSIDYHNVIIHKDHGFNTVDLFGAEVKADSVKHHLNSYKEVVSISAKLAKPVTQIIIRDQLIKIIECDRHYADDLHFYPNWKMRSLCLAEPTLFKLKNGTEVLLKNKVLFDEEEFPSSGSTANASEFIVIPGQTIICGDPSNHYYYRKLEIELRKDGRVKKCFVQGGQEISPNKILVKDNNVEWNNEGIAAIPGFWNDYSIYNLETNSGGLLSSYGHEARDIWDQRNEWRNVYYSFSDYRLGSNDRYSDEYGDYIVKIKVAHIGEADNVPVIANVDPGSEIAFFFNGRYARVTLKQQSKFEYNYNSLLLAAKGKCARFSDKSIDGIVKFKESGALIEGILDAPTNLEWAPEVSGQSGKIKVPAKNRIYLNGKGELLKHVPLCN